MANGKTAVLDEMLEPVTRAFSRDVAEALVQVKASRVAEARISELADKCTDGSLTPTERQEYEAYVHAIDLISVLQAKARLWLARQKAA